MLPEHLEVGEHGQPRRLRGVDPAITTNNKSQQVLFEVDDDPFEQAPPSFYL